MKYYKILLALLVVGLWSCDNETESTPEMPMDHHDHMEHHHHEDMPSTGPVTDMSVYNVSSDWTTQNGESIQLESLQGKVQVIAMVYTTCQYACPRIVADLQRIESAVKQKGLQDQVNFVLVSIDPSVDTPDRLKEFAEENNLSDEHWTLLNGADESILELAAMLGVRYKRTSDVDYAHSNII